MPAHPILGQHHRALMHPEIALHPTPADPHQGPSPDRASMMMCLTGAIVRHGGQGMPDRPVVVRDGEGADYDLGGPSRIRVRLTADDSDGLLTVFEVTGDAVRSPSEANQHLHEDFTEVFYVIEGELGFVSGDDEPVLGLGPGSLIVVPPGTPHGLAPSGPWRHLTLVLPGGFDRYFTEVAAILAAGGGADERAAIAARYGTHPVVTRQPDERTSQP